MNWLMFSGMSGVLGLIFVGFATVYVLRQSTGNARMVEISQAIHDGAMAYLSRQYKVLTLFIIVVGIILGLFISSYSSLAFLVGAILSLLSGFIGMKIGVSANARTAEAVSNNLNHGLRVAFFSGSVMGVTVVSLGVIGVTGIYFILTSKLDMFTAIQIIPAFSFGASSVALFARVGGGIFTKSADVGADLVGKVEAGIPEDDPRNPAVIADNVGDNVGDIAGMGADLYESYVGSIIAPITIGFAAFYMSSAESVKALGLNSMILPLVIAGIGILCSVFGTFFVRVSSDKAEQGVLLMALRRGVWIAAIGTALISLIAIKYIMGDWEIPWVSYILKEQGYVGIFYATLAGLIAGIIIGVATEYYTSQEYQPTRDIADASQTGAATTIIRGMAVGMQSTGIPIITVAIALLAAYYLARGNTGDARIDFLIGIYGISLAGIGMLSTLGITLATDAYGPVADNAGGIATQAQLPPEVRERTDALDSLGNTTAATGKGFAIGSAALTALGLTIAFIQAADFARAKAGLPPVETSLTLTNPLVLAGLFIGGMLPFLFCSFTLQAVGRAAYSMVNEVRRQWREIPGLMEGKTKPDYARCVDIATIGAQKEMIIPAMMAVIAPLLIGFLLGDAALVGLLTGAIVTGFLVAVMMANAGGAWDNAKKYIEGGAYGGKGSEAHKAGVVGDTVGDPFKDTSGPSLNILIKLMSIVALVFAALIVQNMLIH
ncbi:MAG: sodium-translocating pyrophosphatase [Nitrospinae bacterium RIFCSPLOWO2_12_FULL_45_22]|nr:MAG: sodium-translocating pyrophosphatase [Nitrospinae bacterium RIFCSPLOWO2_12_FULL_45_22]